jgi:flagellar basal-body rod protein FlgB
MIYKDFIFKQKLPLLNRSLDAYSLRQKVIAKNIANATTPDYSPEKVKFEEYFNEAEVSARGVLSDTKHIPIGKKDPGEVEANAAEAEIPAAETYFSGESHVNIDKEMASLAQNQIRYRFASQMVKGYFQGLQTSITGQKGA